MRDHGGQAETFDGANTILLEGVMVAQFAVGLAYSAADFIFTA